MNRFWRFFCFWVVFFLIAHNVSAKQYKLFSDGKSFYSIIIAEEASESEKYAAKELQTFIEKISGAYIPFKHCGTGKKGCRIIVGYNSDVKTLFPMIQHPSADDESFFYKNKDGDIVIMGGSERGTMYGVFSFLENEFGCRWYTQSCTIIPTKKNYVFNTLDFSDSPKIPVRNIMYSEIRDAEFRTHCRINEIIKTSPVKPETQVGGCYGLLAPHTFWFLLPVETYFEEHPEYFAMRNGKRQNGKTQPCFTNPDVLRIITNNLLNIMREHPEFDFYEASALDNRNHCECDNCRATIARMGSYSDFLLDFVNKIAIVAEKEFPDKRIEFLAYQDTRHPPVKTRPKNNVVVRIAGLEVCHVHGFEECSSKEALSFYNDLFGWRRIASDLNVWDYASNFSEYNNPYPNFYALQKNIVSYHRLGVKGILEEGNHYTYNGEFQALHIYVTTRLLWNPYCDLDALVNDFLQGYYGASSKYVRQYFDLIHSRVGEGTHMTPVTFFTNPYYDDNLIVEALKIFEKAKKVADNDEILRRVELEEFAICLVNSLRNPNKSIKDGTFKQAMTVMERENIDLRKEELKSRISKLQSENGEEKDILQDFWKNIKKWFQNIIDLGV